MIRTGTLTVEQEQIKLQSFLNMNGFSSAQIRSMKQYGGITKDGEIIFTNAIVFKGDKISLALCDENENSNGILPSDTPINIAFENEDVLIVDKPYNMPTHPSHNHYEDSLANAVMGYYKSQNQKFVFRCVTRLDRETSGLCVIAKNAYTHEFLKQKLHTDSFIREYTALVSGVVEKDGFIDAPIRRAEQSIITRIVAPDGDYAYTSYRVLENRANQTLLRLRLKTGRTHQIRVHMSHIGHSIVGDTLYGTPSNTRLCLHSSLVELPLPFSNETVKIISNPDF